MLELYHNDMSVCAQKVRFALAEKKLAWEGHHLNLRAGDQQEPEYLKLNPNAVVPTLVDDGNIIIESTVICEYLDDAYPEPKLKPVNAVGRARMRLWTKQLDEGVHAATSVVSSAIAFRYQKLAIGMEALEEFHKKNARSGEAGKELGERYQRRRVALLPRRSSASTACSQTWKKL